MTKKKPWYCYGSIGIGRTALLDPLPWPKEKNDLRNLLLQPSLGLKSLTGLFCCKISWIAKYSCLSLDESIEKDLLMGWIENWSSLPLVSMHSSSMLATWWNFLAFLGTILCSSFLGDGLIDGADNSLEFSLSGGLSSDESAELSFPNSITTKSSSPPM